MCFFPSLRNFFGFCFYTVAVLRYPVLNSHSHFLIPLFRCSLVCVLAYIKGDFLSSLLTLRPRYAPYVTCQTRSDAFFVVRLFTLLRLVTSVWIWRPSLLLIHRCMVVPAVMSIVARSVISLCCDRLAIAMYESSSERHKLQTAVQL